MKMYLISDNVDTRTGMRLAGVEGCVVNSADEIKKEMEKVLADPEIGIVLVTEKILKVIPEYFSDIKINRKLPLIVEIPDRHGSGRDKNSIMSYISEAIGLRL